MRIKKISYVLLALVMVAALALTACNHVHKYTDWAYNSNQHWKVCPDDGEIDEATRANHNFVDGKCECGAVKNTSGGGGQGTQPGSGDPTVDTTPMAPEHEGDGHQTEWRYDAMQHWKFCTTHNAVDMATYQAHNFVNGQCECGATPHTHVYNTWRYNSEGHWKACDICGAAQSQTVTPHVFDNKVCECGAREKEEFTDMPGGGGSSIGGGGEGVPGDYVVVGSGRLGDWADNIESQRLLHYTDNADDPNQSIRIDLKAGESFKLKKWNTGPDNWEGSLGCNSPIWFDGDGVKLGQYEGIAMSGLFTYDGENIKVVADCNVSLTVHDNDDPPKLCIYVHSYVGEITKPENTGWWLVGTLNGTDSWNDFTGNARHLDYDEATDTYSVTYTFQKGDSFQVKPAGTWTGQCGYSALGNITYSTTQRPSGDLFTVSGMYNSDIGVNYACTLKITLTASHKLDIEVTSITL